MITELARITIKPGTEDDFLAAVERSVPLFLNAKGNLGVNLSKVIEEPGVFVLTVGWQTLEDHTVTFRGSTSFDQWRSNVSSYFAEAPAVIHLAPQVSA
ncbi:MAG: putative quinol monooxygenase [Roseinatronobacter sp.]